MTLVSLLRCRRCNQVVLRSEDYSVSRSRGIRMAVHATCPNPAFWTQCAFLIVNDDYTQTQCQAIADGRTGYCEAHRG